MRAIRQFSQDNQVPNQMPPPNFVPQRSYQEPLDQATIEKNKKGQMMVEMFMGAVENMIDKNGIRSVDDVFVRDGRLSIDNFRELRPYFEMLADEIAKLKEMYGKKESDDSEETVQRIEGEVTVKNQVVMPDYPTETAISELPEDIYTAFANLQKAIEAIKINPVVNVAAPTSSVAPKVSVNVDSAELSKEVAKLEKAIQALPALMPQTTVDFSSLFDAVRNVESAIKNLQFPIPNFRSSFQDSIDMQSKDRARTYVYTTVASTKVISYIQFTSLSGQTYRKTYGYTSADPDNPDSDTGWVAL